MPDAPDKPFDTAAHARDKEARKNSPAYRKVHPTVKVWDFVRLKGNYKAQRRIDRECEELEGGVRRWVAATDHREAHWLVKVGEEWKAEKLAE